MRIDLVLLVSLPLLVSGVAFTVATRHESRYERARRAGRTASYER